MLEESIPAIWASMNSWFTPTVLFVVLNLMIGTIAVASGIGNPKHDQHQTQNNQNEETKLHPQLVRSPSVLQRIKSFNLNRFRSEDTNPFSSVTANLFQHHLPAEPTEIRQTQTTPTQIETQTQKPPQTHEAEPESEEEEAFDTLDKVFEHHVLRTKSETMPASGDMPVKLPRKMKKSASTKSAFAHFEEEQIVDQVVPNRPSTVRERKKTESDVQPFGDDEEVDAKADDFINRFKQQLKLQRLDSIIRYKEMLKRG